MKVKKEKRREAEEEEEAAETTVEIKQEPPERTYEEMVATLNPIAQPLAGRKLTKRLYKCIKKAVKHKNIRRGVKEVQKFLNKGEKGIVVLAGDTLPIEVYCHVPIMCEDRGIPYAYIPSKSDLGAAAGSKRPTCVILVKPNAEYEDAYNDCVEDVQTLPQPY
ncbi:H/ACA ribonucleoprotein complex subunit 2 [Hyperolius riggenbachi]|uniref:H/ACA ribonucleoprotein complex subunit 2 n=1 Tax=Hyperolius riggenbachi TaxID=752182 RepID=UPI0035A32E32